VICVSVRRHNDVRKLFSLHFIILAAVYKRRKSFSQDSAEVRPPCTEVWLAEVFGEASRRPYFFSDDDSFLSRPSSGPDGREFFVLNIVDAKGAEQ